MKNYFTAFSMAQSMFCALPFPCKNWREDARSKMLLFLPVIGFEIGALWVLTDWLMCFLNVSEILAGLVLCVLPYILTGFIHIDGFMDVTDAIGSWRSLEERRRILKDSHVGAFGVIGCVLVLLTGFAVFASRPFSADGRCLLFIPVLSRCCSALAVWLLPPMSGSQYADNKMRFSRWHIFAVAALMLGCVFAGFIWLGRYGVVSLGVLVGFSVALLKCYHSLKGMNGDISGYCITVSELCAAAVYVLL